MRSSPKIAIRIITGQLLALIAVVGSYSPSIAFGQDGAATTRENLMVVLRETTGANKPDETLVPAGKGKAKLPDGREVEVNSAWFDFIGDMHIRFVFDGPTSMRGATPQDLTQLDLSTDQALQLAIANVKRVYGEPTAKPWSGGLMEVQGKSPDLDSSYFLDRSYWRGLAKQYPEGIVVAVPKRGGLLYVPLSDEKTVQTLRNAIGPLFTSSERLRVSSGLYLFKDDKWSVFQAPLRQ
jgi:hypothetical protein